METIDTRVDATTIVVEVRPTVNQMARSIEHIVARMRTSHLQLFDLLLDDLRKANPPKSTLDDLRAGRQSKEKQSGLWFNVPSNYQSATNEVLELATEVVKKLAKKDTWSSEATDGLQERMRECAALCGRWGQADEAAELLLLAARVQQSRAKHPAGRKMINRRASVNSIQQLEAPDQLVFQVLKPNDDEDACTALLALIPIICSAEISPALVPALVMLMDRSKTATRTLNKLIPMISRRVERDLVTNRFQVGCPVLTYSKDLGLWMDAKIKDCKTNEKGEVVSFDVFTEDGVFLDKKEQWEVLAPADGGFGALMREAARSGCASLVQALLDARVSPFECTANPSEAFTALHAAAYA